MKGRTVRKQKRIDYSISTHDLETSAKAFRERLAVSYRLPGVSQDQRGEHGSQADTMFAGTRVPAQSLPFA